ncbi:MAG: hypothetical protein IPK26_26230 [Planctomycetes bacterium]|nr:hypothetical protein [Planctomycetota bacterium]
MAPFTAAASVTLTGRALRGASMVEVAGGQDTVSTRAQDNRSFSLEVPLRPNRLNQLVVRELFADGTISPAVIVPVTQDSVPPAVTISYPLNGDVVSGSATTVVGSVGDVLSGAAGIKVTVNGVDAPTARGIGSQSSFSLGGVALVAGQTNTIRVEATDTVGNTAAATVDVRQETPSGNGLLPFAGDGQSGTVSEYLGQPIAVRLTRPDGSPFVGKVVTFTVTRSNGRLSGDRGLEPRQQFAAVTDGNGVASVFWRLGSDAGVGNNRVRATSLDVAGVATFVASGRVGAARQINVASGGRQVGQTTGPAAELLAVWVNDGCNGVGGVPVTFAVVAGAGVLTAGQSFSLPAVTVTTDSSGHASAELTLGPAPGDNLVAATWPGNPGRPAMFTVVGVAATGGSTAFLGQVFDNAQQPLQDAVARIVFGDGTERLATTDAAGEFMVDDLPQSGRADLFVDGASVTAIAGRPRDPQRMRFPALHWEVTIISGAVNRLPSAVLLPVLDPVNDRMYDGSQDVVLTCAGIAGLSVTIAAGSMTLPDGRRPTPQTPLPAAIPVAINQVHYDSVPMPIPDGASPVFTWTVQPGGARFEPPARISYPNMSGLAAGSLSYFLTFDHDTGRFEVVGSGRVSADGSMIESDPGAGLTLAGWGCNCPPYAVTGDCEEERKCADATFSFTSSAAQSYGYDEVAGSAVDYVSLDRAGSTRVIVQAAPSGDGFVVTSSNPAVFTVAGGSVALSGASTEVVLTGANGGADRASALLQVRANDAAGAVCGTLNVEVYKKLNVATVSFYRIRDPGVAATTPAQNPTFAELRTAMNNVYKQAVIDVGAVNGNRDQQIAYDLNGNGKLDYYNDGANPERDAITGAGLAGDPKIAYVEEMRDNWRLAAAAASGQNRVRLVSVAGLAPGQYDLGPATGAAETITVASIAAATNELVLAAALANNHAATDTVYQGLAGLSSNPQLVTDAGGELIITLVHEMLHRPSFGSLADVAETDNILYYTTGGTGAGMLRYRGQTIVDTGTGVPTGGTENQWNRVAR